MQLTLAGGEQPGIGIGPQVAQSSTAACSRFDIKSPRAAAKMATCAQSASHELPGATTTQSEALTQGPWYFSAS